MKIMWAAIAAFFSVSSVTAKAAPITDSFSFTGNYRMPNGTIIGTGTVTGTITFAGAGTGIAPTSVYVLSEPANTLGSGDSATTNFAAATYEFADSFTVEQNGTVDAENMSAVTNFANGSYISFTSTFAELSSYSSGYYISALNAATFTPASGAPVPEPAAVCILAVGAIATVAFRRGRAAAAH